MRSRLLLLLLCLTLAACAAHAPRCEGPLQPINTHQAAAVAPLHPPAAADTVAP
jgi:hypothetical protein